MIMKLILLLISSIVSVTSFSAETWELLMILDVPRVAENTKSLGFRKYQKQKIRAFFTVDRREDSEPDVTFLSMENLTHNVGCKNVTYDVTVEDVKWHGIGSNSKNVFDVRSVVISIIADPSYSIGEYATDDNSLVLTFSGKGRDGSISGFAAGQIGCGCHDYGHVSPTRIWSTEEVVDVASTYGKWKAKRVR